MKKKIFVFLFIFIFTPFCISIINFTIDLTLKFGSVNSLNKNFPESMEREQKTNLVYRTARHFDSVMLGSSRTANINQNYFFNMKTFNYAFSWGRLSEFKPYLDFFSSSNGNNIKNIILGLDFFHTNNNHNNIPPKEKPENYIKEAQSIENTYKGFFSLDLFKKSLGSTKIDYAKTKGAFYDRYNIKYQNKIVGEEKSKLYEMRLKDMLKFNYGKSYSWYNEIFTRYAKIKESYPNAKIIAFTNPIGSDLFATFMKKAGHFENYKKWIKGLVEVYGEIYCFMGINSITTNLENYSDGDHYYPEIGKIIAYKLSTMDFDSEPKDFGVIVNNDNVDEFLEFQAKQLENYEFSEFYPHDEIDKIINEAK